MAEREVTGEWLRKANEPECGEAPRRARAPAIEVS
jgi:hypothetical protein